MDSHAKICCGFLTFQWCCITLPYSITAIILSGLWFHSHKKIATWIIAYCAYSLLPLPTAYSPFYLKPTRKLKIVTLFSAFFLWIVDLGFLAWGTWLIFGDEGEECRNSGARAMNLWYLSLVTAIIGYLGVLFSPAR